MNDWMTGTTASTSEPSEGLTLAKLMEAKRRIDALGPPPPAVKIVEDANAVLRQQARVYPKRKAKNAAHRQRMNNKWRKRYGFTYTPTMYQLDMTFTGLGREKMFIVHPALMPRIRAAAKASESQQ